jgi:hypothetical protein
MIIYKSLRSGISDLVAVSSTAKNIVIYPTKFDQEIIKILVNAFGNFDIAQFIFEKWSLRKILNKGYEVFDDKLNLQGMLDYMESKEN